MPCLLPACRYVSAKRRAMPSEATVGYLEKKIEMPVMKEMRNRIRFRQSIICGDSAESPGLTACRPPCGVAGSCDSDPDPMNRRTPRAPPPFASPDPFVFFLSDFVFVDNSDRICCQVFSCQSALLKTVLGALGAGAYVEVGLGCPNSLLELILSHSAK